MSRSESDVTSGQYYEASVVVALAVGAAAILVERYHIDHGQWVIWSAASVVTGDVVTARAKLRDRLLGAVVGVPAGAIVALTVPHDHVLSEFAAVAARLTLVSFKRYSLGFGVRCAFIAAAFVIADQPTVAAGARLDSVVLGGAIGFMFVLGVHAIATSRCVRGHFPCKEGDICIAKDRSSKPRR